MSEKICTPQGEGILVGCKREKGFITAIFVSLAPQIDIVTGQYRIVAINIEHEEEVSLDW